MLRNRLRRAVVTVAVILSAVGISIIGVPAHAYSNAFFATQSTGDRGVDVLTIQYLLNHHGQTVSPDGVFGSTTNTAVRAFQTARGLDVDGIVGPNTWAALVPQISQGASGDAVRALQVQLNEKRRLSLTVNGQFDAATTSA